MGQGLFFDFVHGVLWERGVVEFRLATSWEGVLMAWGVLGISPHGPRNIFGSRHGPRNMFELRLARAKGERQQGQRAEGKRPKMRKRKGLKAKAAGQRHRRKNVFSFTKGQPPPQSSTPAQGCPWVDHIFSTLPLPLSFACCLGLLHLSQQHPPFPPAQHPCTGVLLGGAL
jgi:hypothetical protein